MNNSHKLISISSIGNHTVTDNNLISSDNRKYIAIALKNGIVSGNSNGTLNPKGVLTRAQIAAIMNNVDVEVVTTENIYTIDGTIVAEGEFQIFTITGQNVTNLNGNLKNGVYIVKSANATTKVVIK
jgi:hypothetical protein